MNIHQRMLQHQFFNYDKHEALSLSNDEKERLFQSNNSIGEIAYLLGFEYPNHFSKLLNAKKGISPKELRRLIYCLLDEFEAFRQLLSCLRCRQSGKGL